jgi:hypothetical protein
MNPKAFLNAISGVSTTWSLAAFAIAAIVYMATRKQKGAARSGGTAAMVIILLLGLVPILGSFYMETRKNEPSVYQLRVVVLDPQQTPLEDAKVWSSLGGEPKKVAGGWQFDIPVASLPSDRKLTVYATESASFLKGQSQLTLASDVHPNTTIQLMHPETTVRGIVTDAKGHAIEGVAVSVIGHGNETVRTKADGGFELPAHAADGQQVELHAEKGGFTPSGGWFPAGTVPAELVLKRQ